MVSLLNIFGMSALFIFLVCPSPASAGKLQLGMSREDVARLLGEPDRRQVLVGKVLRDLDTVPPEDLTRLRLVYIYETLGIQVWFKGDKVTGATRNGISIL
jgi:hypothetical protein